MRALDYKKIEVNKVRAAGKIGSHIINLSE